MQTVLIILLGIFSAVTYGIVHDQVTVRICIEYFTIGHPPVFSTESPTLLALGWGVIATWWVGLLLGVPLAMAAQVGRRPRRTATSLVRPILVLLTIMACCALIAGVVGLVLAKIELLRLPEPLASMVPRDKHVRFIIDWCAHLGSYISGFAGGVVLIVMTWKSRRRGRVPPCNPPEIR
jgi:membrane associated rhomboid family serine protease